MWGQPGWPTRSECCYPDIPDLMPEGPLLSRGGSTFEGWTELGAKRAQHLGRLELLRVRPSDLLDADGNPIPARRHHRRTAPHPDPAVSLER